MIRRREGFTLVELLVVITIIIILAAILFPVFARAREKAQQTKCMNNMKQMGSAIALYEDDYDNPMPFNVMCNNIRADGFTLFSWEYQYFWKDLMEPYVKQLKNGQYAGQLEEWEGELYKCPSAPIEEFTLAYTAMRTYGYNGYFNKSVTYANFKFPSSTLRITEGCTYDPDDPNAIKNGGSWWAPMPGLGGVRAPGWHNGMNNVLWGDGHVSSVPRERVMLRDNNANYNVWCRLSPKPAFTPE